MANDFSPRQGNNLNATTTINNVGVYTSNIQGVPTGPVPAAATIVVAPLEVHMTPASAPAIPEGLRTATENPFAPGHNGPEGVWANAPNWVDPGVAILDPIQGHIGKTVAPVNQTLRPDRGSGGGTLIQFRSPA